MSFKILVAEDKRLLAEDIVDRLQSFGHQTILGPCASGEDALAMAEEDMPDIAILDIELGGAVNGIEVATRLNKKKQVPIIYLTHQQDERTYNDSLSTFPIAYINKPFTNNELKMAVHNAVRTIDQETHQAHPTVDEPDTLDDRIFIRNGRGKYHIMLDDILWIRSGGGETSTIITAKHLEGDPKRRPVVGHTLQRLESRLSFYPHLVRCSRFHIVNLKAVEKILDNPENRTKKSFLIKGEEIDIGDKYRKEVMERLRIL